MADTEEREHQGGEHHGPGAEHGEHGEHGKGAKGAQPPKSEKRKTALIVILTAAGVLIAWLSLRNNSKTAAAATTPTGSSANDPLNYPQSNGDVAGFGLGNTNGLDPNAYMGLQQQLDQLSSQISKLSSTTGGSSNGSGFNVNVYENPPPHGPFPWSPHSGTTAGPHPLSAEGVLVGKETVAQWAKDVKVPAGSVFRSGNNVWTFATRGNPNEGPTAEAKLKPGQSLAQWAASVHVPVSSVQRRGSNVWTYAKRS